MSVRLSLLAILNQGPCYGYQLRTELDWRTGSTGPINVGQVYNTLDRLERDKLVRKTGENNYYEITRLGSTEVARWFASVSARADLPAKLALAVTLPGVDVESIVRVQRSAPSSADISSTTAPVTVAELAAAIVARADAAAAASESRLLDDVEALLALGIPPRALSNEVPRRGRPTKAPTGG